MALFDARPARTSGHHPNPPLQGIHSPTLSSYSGSGDGPAMRWNTRRDYQTPALTGPPPRTFVDAAEVIRDAVDAARESVRLALDAPRTPTWKERAAVGFLAYWGEAGRERGMPLPAGKAEMSLAVMEQWAKEGERAAEKRLATREEQLAAREKKIEKERAASIACEERLAAREGEMAKKERAAAAREEKLVVLATREEQLVAREKKIEKERAAAVAREERLVAREGELAKKEWAAAALEEKLVELATREEQLAAREKKIEKQRAAAVACEERLAAREGELARKERAAAAREEKLFEQEQAAAAASKLAKLDEARLAARQEELATHFCGDWAVPTAFERAVPSAPFAQNHRHRMEMEVPVKRESIDAEDIYPQETDKETGWPTAMASAETSALDSEVPGTWRGKRENRKKKASGGDGSDVIELSDTEVKMNGERLACRAKGCRNLSTGKHNFCAKHWKAAKKMGWVVDHRLLSVRENGAGRPGAPKRGAGRPGAPKRGAATEPKSVDSTLKSAGPGTSVKEQSIASGNANSEEIEESTEYGKELWGLDEVLSESVGAVAATSSSQHPPAACDQAALSHNLESGGQRKAIGSSAGINWDRIPAENRKHDGGEDGKAGKKKRRTNPNEGDDQSVANRNPSPALNSEVHGTDDALSDKEQIRAGGDADRKETEENTAEEGPWELKEVFSMKQLSMSKPILCNTDDCDLVACSHWVCNDPNEPDYPSWFSCLDCQESDYGGWPRLESGDLPIKFLTQEHSEIIAKKCSKQDNPTMPNIPITKPPVATPVYYYSSEEEEDLDSSEEEEDQMKLGKIIACKSMPLKEWKVICGKMNTTEITNGSRWVQLNEEGDPERYEERFLVKWNDLSHLHCSWETERDLVEFCESAKGKMRTFFRKAEGGLLYGADERLDGDYFDPSWTTIERILETTLDDEDEVESTEIILDKNHPGFEDGTGCQFYVKWVNKPYSESSYEFERDLILNEVDYKKHLESYDKRKVKPTKKEMSKQEMESHKQRRQLYKIFGEKIKHPDEARDELVKGYQKELEGMVFKNGGQLRDYQVKGVSQLMLNHLNKRSSILADEMGLGETIETVTYIYAVSRQLVTRGPFLIVAPHYTIPHWYREFTGWTDLNTIIYRGSACDRRRAREEEFVFPQDRIKDVVFNSLYLTEVAKGWRDKWEKTWMVEVVITTPEMLVTEEDFLELAVVQWEILVVDKVRRLENHNSKLAQNLRDESFQFKHSLLLTGTPIQNNMQKLWSLLNFINPETFDNLERFMGHYGDTKSKDRVDGLHKTIRPYILRRFKQDVEKSVLPKGGDTY